MARRRGTRTIDFKQWDAIPSIEINSAANTTSLGGALSFSGPATILRARGQVVIMAADGQSLDGSALIASVGLGIVSTDAYTAGAASMPDPSGEPEYPWLFWKEIFIVKNDISTTAPILYPVPEAICQRIEIDTKAMRKVKPGETLCWVTQTGAGFSVDFCFAQTRVLIGT